MKFISKLADSISARDTLIFIETIEENEVIKDLKSISLSLNQSLILWNSIEGWKDITPEGGMFAMQPMGEVYELHDMLSEISYSTPKVKTNFKIN